MTVDGERLPIARSFEVLSLERVAKGKHQDILASMKQLEKRTFPAGEAFDFHIELPKRNTRVLVAIQQETFVLGYLIYLRMKRTTLLHKVCVGAGHRGRGIGKALISEVIDKVKDEGCVTIQLWVDEARKAAEALYRNQGFEVVRRVEGYYAPGRVGLKMLLNLESPSANV